MKIVEVYTDETTIEILLTLAANIAILNEFISISGKTILYKNLPLHWFQ